MSDFFNPEATPPLDEFLTEYNENDNIWWAMSCGHHMNLFDAALERIDELTGTSEMLWGKVADLTRQRDDAVSELAAYKKIPIIAQHDAMQVEIADLKRALSDARRIAIEAGAFL